MRLVLTRLGAGALALTHETSGASAFNERVLVLRPLH